MAYSVGFDRKQSMLLPESLEEYIAADHRQLIRARGLE